MSALFVIRQHGTTELFFGEHMADVALAVFARGPWAPRHALLEASWAGAPVDRVDLHAHALRGVSQPA